MDGSAEGSTGRSRTVEETWNRLDIWYGEHLPEVLESLGAPASEDGIRELEAVIGADLPDVVRASFRVHDGQVLSGVGTTGAIFGLQLLPIDEVISQWKNWDLITKEFEDDEDMHEWAESAPDGAIRLRYSHPGWIPLTHDFGGNHIGVDLDPGPNGTRGQVVIFGRDEELKHVIAKDWAAFLSDVADELEAGNFEIGENRQLSVADPPLHFHNAAVELGKRRGG